MGVEASLNTASSVNGYAAVGSAVLQIGGTMLSMYNNRKMAKYQARIARANAKMQANQYAAEAVGYEMTARRLAQAYGAQEYEAIRQQNAYLEDMSLDAAIRGGAMEGTNRYLIAAQEQEFARGNAYGQLANAREQANYMTAAAQSIQNAKNAYAAGEVTAKGIRAQERASRISSVLNMTASLVGTASNYATTESNINAHRELYKLNTQANAYNFGLQQRTNALAWNTGGGDVSSRYGVQNFGAYLNR